MYHAAVGTGAQAASEKQTEQPAPSRMTKGKGRGKGKSRRQVMEVVMVARRQNAGQAATPLADPSAIASGEPIVPTADGHLENVGNASSNPNSAAENSTAPTPTIPAKRKPGRPKKVVPPAIPPPSNDYAAVEDVVQPRAALFARLSPPVVPIKTQDGPELSSPEIVKRPRGRPRKNIAAVTVSVYSGRADEIEPIWTVVQPFLCCDTTRGRACSGPYVVGQTHKDGCRNSED